MSVKKLKIKKAPSKNVDDIYQKMEHKIHIYEKPDTYVGSCEKEEVSTFVFNDETSKIKMITTQYSPAWYKCLDELTVNAHDHKKRMDKVITIRIGNSTPSIEV